MVFVKCLGVYRGMVLLLRSLKRELRKCVWQCGNLYHWFVIMVRWILSIRGNTITLSRKQKVAKINVYSELVLR